MPLAQSPAERATVLTKMKEELAQENHEKKQELLDHVDAFLAGNETAQNLRNFIRDSIIKIENAETKAFCDKAFLLQLLLTEMSPLNSNDAEGQPIDPILQLEEGIPERARVLASEGYIFDKTALSDYFKTNNAFKINQETNTIELKNPLGGLFSPREIAHFEENGVIIPERNNNLRSAVNLARSLGQGGAQVDNVLGLNLSGRMNGFLNRLIQSRYFGGFFVGAATFGMAGFVLGAFMSLPLIFLAVLTLPSYGLLAVLGVSVLCGLIELRRGGSGFLQGFSAGIVGSSLVFLAASLGPLIIAGLGAASLISSAAAATATGVWTMLQPLVPVVLGLVTAVREYFKPGTMRETFENIHKATLVTLGVIGGAVLGLVGGCLGLVASVFSSALRGGGAARRPPAPQPAQEAAPAFEVNEVPVVVLSPNARVQQLFGQNAQQGAYSPRTAQAIFEAQQEDGPLTPRTALLFQQQLLMQNDQRAMEEDVVNQSASLRCV
jgi:hypothetical protein